MATFHDCINSIYQFIKPFLDNNMSIFEEYGTFKVICLFEFRRIVIVNNLSVIIVMVS